MARLQRGVVIVAALVAASCRLLPHGFSVPTSEPIDWEREPIQTDTSRTPFTIETRRGVVTVHPRAEFDVSAVVASAEHYSLDAGAFVCPVDLAMTWGNLPQPPYKDRITYDQMDRFYFWRTAERLDLNYIATHSANMHMVPSTKNLARALGGIGSGDRVRIKGLLVDIDRRDGFLWRTSMTRLDTGPGACELVWVEELQRSDRLYH
jgi:hypothetical protein